MTLKYFIAECLNDSCAYSIRRKTKKEVVAHLTELGCTVRSNGEWIGGDGNHYQFSKVHAVTVEYSDGFDLLDQCLSEGRIYEGKNQ